MFTIIEVIIANFITLGLMFVLLKKWYNKNEAQINEAKNKIQDTAKNVSEVADKLEEVLKKIGDIKIPSIPTSTNTKSTAVKKQKEQENSKK